MVTQEQEAARVGATFRLAFAAKQHPELKRAEAEARLDLAAAIMAMDEADGDPMRHSLQEQAEVEAATDTYADALANLLRGEADAQQVERFHEWENERLAEGMWDS